MSAARRVVRWLALACSALPLPAAAQESTESEPSGEILVSAKAGEEQLLDYAGSATVIDAAELERRAFQDLATLSYASPNVTLDAIGTFRGVANFAIRGLGINSSIPSIDPAVGLFVDGIYQGINAGTVFDMLDVERVEVLRGPQGVSFGRNTTGGAVMVRTADPEESWSGYARAGLEGPVDGGRGAATWTARAVVTGPLADGLSFRLGGLYSDDGGYFENGFDGRAFAGSQTRIVRGGLAWRGGSVELVAKGEWSGSEGDGAPAHSNGLFARDTFEISVNQRGFHDSETGSASLRAQLELGGGTLSNLFGWRTYDLKTRNDIDSTPQPIFQSDTRTAQDQWSNELTWAVERGPLSAVTGFYLFGQDVAYDESRDLSFFGAAPQYGGGRQEHAVLALFGELTYEVLPALELSAGLRWSRERKRGEITYVRPRAPCSVIDGTCPVDGQRVAGENNGFDDERTWKALSPRLAATFRLDADARLYASWTRGQRSGGYNLRITQPAAFEQVAAAFGSPAFDEEQVDSFELGAKWRSRDGRLSLDAAVFRSDVDGLQRELSVPSASSGLAQSVYNTADARIRGFELEGRLLAAPGLSLGAQVGLADAEYRRILFDLTGDGAIDAADLALELPRAPKWTWGFDAQYERALSTTRTLTAALFFQHRDRAAYTDNNWGWNAAANRLDASLALGCGSCRMTLRLYGRNLFDEVQFGGDTQLGFAAGPFSNGINRPFDPAPGAGTFSPLQKGRVLGAEIGYAF